MNYPTTLAADKQTSSATGLIPADRTQYEEQGHFIRKNLFSSDEIDRLCERVETLFDAALGRELTPADLQDQPVAHGYDE